jgi:hypothetical protein
LRFEVCALFVRQNQISLALFWYLSKSQPTVSENYKKGEFVVGIFRKVKATDGNYNQKNNNINKFLHKIVPPPPNSSLFFYRKAWQLSQENCHAYLRADSCPR